MKRLTVLFLLSLFSIFSIFSQTVNFGVVTNLPIKQDFTNETAAVEFLAEGDYANFETNAGIKISNGQFNFTTCGFYMPQIINTRLNVGGGIAYHLLKYEDIFNESNLLITTKARYTTKKQFTIDTAYSFLMIFTEINSIKKSVPCIFKWNTSIDVLMSQKFSDTIKCYWDITSHDYFDFPYLGIPYIKSGVEYSGFQNLILFVDYTIKLEDMFTSTTYVSGSYLRFGAKVQL